MSTARNYVPRYTVEDYRLWEGDWELWEGTAVAMTPSPFGSHARLIIDVGSALKLAIDAAGCNATVMAEIDWIVSENTVLRPDITVVCGPAPARHVGHAPALVVEIVSESTRQRDLTHKRSVYQEQGVAFYLIIDPDQQTLSALRIVDGQYVALENEDWLELQICDECSLEVQLGNLFT